MRKLYLLLVMLCVCIGVRAYEGTYTYSEGTVTLSMDSNGFQTVECSGAGAFTAFATQHADVFNSTSTEWVFKGQMNAGDFNKFTSSATLNNIVTYCDFSGVEVVGDFDASTVGFGTNLSTLILPSTTTLAEIGKLQAKYNNNICLAYFTAPNRLSAYAFNSKVAGLKNIVTDETALTFMPVYSQEGAFSNYVYNTAENGVDNGFLQGVGQLPVVSIDFSMIAVDMSTDFSVLNEKTKYISIPLSGKGYNWTEDTESGYTYFTGTGNDYFYPENIEVVSTYKSNVTPYASECTYDGFDFVATESTNITYIRKAGALAGARAYVSDFQRQAACQTFVGDLNAQDIAAMDVLQSTSLNFAKANCTSEVISGLSNTHVQYLALPDNTDDVLTATSEDDFSLKSHFPALICAGVYNTEAGLYKVHSTEAGHVKKVTSMIHPKSKDIRNSGNLATGLENIVFSGYFNNEDINVSAATGNNSGLESAVIKNADLTNAVFLPNDEFVLSGQEGVNGAGWGNIETVKFPTSSKMTKIPANCLNNSANLKGEVVIPDNFVEIGDYAFWNSGLESATFGSGVRTIGTHLFENCSNMTSVNLNKGLTNISDYCFNGTILEGIAIPEGVTTIGKYALSLVPVSTVRLPNTLERIETGAFKECLNLSTITIPANVQLIESEAFVLCPKLSDVYFLGTTTIPEVPVGAFGEDSYFNNGGVNPLEPRYSGDTHNYGQYSEALSQYSAQADRVDHSYWATMEDGVKTAGATIMHYPRIKTEAGYTETDYTTSYQNYQSDLAAYNTAVEGKAEEVAAYERAYQEYQENLQKYNEAKDIELCWSWGGSCTLADAINQNQFYTKEYGEHYTAIAAWQTNANSDYPIGNGYTYYTLNDGEYTVIDPQPTDYTSANQYASSTGLYVKETGEQIVPLDAETIAILKAGEPIAPDPVEGIPTKPTAPVVYTYDGTDYTAYSGEPVEGVDYYVPTSANNDLYGEYYTVPARNANYGGVYVGEDGENNPLGSLTWPDFQDYSVWTNGQGPRTGISTPDGKNHDGLKNFMLVAGYPKDGEEQTPPVQEIEHIKKDVWYTMCFPFDLTDNQLESCFGAGYEVAQFCAVVENEEKTGIILQFTDAVTPDADGVVTKAHVPYMIHPNSMAVNEDGTPKETVFTLTGIKETIEDHDADQEVLMQNAVTKTFNGTPFTFVGYGHNYLPSQVLIPQFAYFLGTKKGETYPRFFRQTGANDRASKSYWNKNIAVVLPGVDKADASTINFSKIDSRVINSDTKGKQVYEVWDYAEGYYNYICNEYKYVPTASASGVKSLANFDLQIVHTPLTETQPEEATAIEAVEKADSFVAADKFGKVYNISGQYVGKDLNNLPKGVYILNGKKYMVK